MVKKPSKTSFKSSVQRVVVVRPKRKKNSGPRLGNLLRDKQMVKLRYVDSISIDAGAAAVTNHVYWANSIYDPDQTGTGHQPLLRDNYALLYASYRVVSSKMKLTPIMSTTTNSNPAFYGAFLDPDTGLNYSSATQIIEDKTRTKTFGLRQAPLMQASTGKLNRSITVSFNAKRHLAKDDANKSNFMTSNPGTGSDEARYFQIWTGSVHGNNPGVCEFLVEIEYTCELTDPIVITPS